MNDEFDLEEETALNLNLQGSVGSFKVGVGLEGQNSLEVKYFQTHVGLNFTGGSDEALLSHLAPVRELFEFEDLDFDEIMQRDIDDARVSSELIPYILDEKSRDLIKLFPPIVVVILPTKESENKPADRYPKVSNIESSPKEGSKVGKLILRAGDVGQEVFQFEQPILNGKIIEHDKVRLKLNTAKTKLVIVDGQHRAMALLALYRNLKDQWSDEKRAPFKEYYSEWTKNYIRKFNLDNIKLPIIMCTFPGIDSEYSGDSDIKQAARSIFLTLNKTARKVSNSRNILLDDNDIIAAFLRKCLSYIKRIDIRSPYSLRIFNVELDQHGDKVKIQSPVALTGVNHIYYIIEHLMLNNGDVNGSAPRSGKFYKRTDLNTYVCMERLDGRNILGKSVADSTTRDNYSKDVAKILEVSFYEKYGSYIVKLYQEFNPYEAHNRAVLNLETRLETHEDRRLRPILFEGQGMGRVFESHRKTLKERLKGGGYKTDVPQIEEIAKRLDATSDRLMASIEGLKKERVSIFLDKIKDKSKLRENDTIHPKVVSWVNEFYENILTSLAFQSGILCGFFGELEKTNQQLEKEEKTILSTDLCFEELLNQINNFFTPKSSSQFKKMVRIFSGEIEGEITEWKIIKTPHTFRKIVYRGEMQPDQWPKYKYLILEIWRPSDKTLLENINDERDKCRKQIFSNLYNIYKKEYCINISKLEENLEKDEINDIFNSAYNDYSSLLKNLSSEKIDAKTMNDAASLICETIGDEVVNEEVWASVNGI